jgi:glucose-6-phosphate 1-dehydrogenase
MDNLLIIFGATGDLVKNKIFPVIKDLEDTKIVTYTRKKTNSEFTSIVGELNNLTQLRNYVQKYEFKNLFFYVALPPHLYSELIINIVNTFNDIDIHVALEKPFAENLVQAIDLSKTIEKIGKNKFYLVDHYCAKNDLISFRKNDILLNKIDRVDINILETDDLQNRGVFFDRVGVIKDTFQSHALLVANLIIQKPFHSKEFIFVKNSLKTKQFLGYKNIIGVSKNSKTETYFEASFKYKNVLFNFKVGKGQKTKNKSVNIFSNTKIIKTLSLSDNNTLDESPHRKIILDFVSQKNEFSTSIDQSIEQWKITENILNKI